MSRQARQRRRRHNRAGPTRIVLVGGGVLATTLLLGAIAAVGYVLHVAGTAPSLATLHPILSDGSSQVFAADGTRLGFIQSDDVRSPVGWNEIPAELKNATVAIEDQRFYQNNGVDLTAIFRSAVKDIAHGAALQGGSTITMQLMRNLYLGGDQHTLRQKIIEAKLAIDYTEHHSKHSILTSYLNSVPYGTVGGQTATGVQAAARIFFDRPASQLDLEQSALLAGLPQAPSEYNPFLYPAAARKRRNEVLAKMAELHYISAARASATERAPLEVHLGTFYSQRSEPFFFEYVREALEHRYGRRTVEQGGLKVYTTIDLNKQRLARKAIAEVLNEPEDPASAIVTIDPHNGDIEAMAESESYEQSQYNLAADGHRQPGSTFKAIDLADALSRGIDPNSTYYFSHTLAPGWLPGYPSYEVKTFEGTSLDKSISLVDATLASDNTVYAQLAADLGEQTITRNGVQDGRQNPPVELPGGSARRAHARGDAAGNGRRLRDPRRRRLAQQADRDHQGRLSRRPRRLQLGHAPPREGALRRRHRRGDHDPARERPQRDRHALGDRLPTAAKTGTTSELVDAWLDGYTPDYATVVWMGYPNRRVSMTDVHGEPQQGGYLPAEIWHDYMASVTEGQPCVPFPEPKESISYQPFFGHFATTGRTSGAGEQIGAEPLGPGQSTQPNTQHRATPKTGASPTPEAGAKATPEPTAPQTHTPSEPAAPAPLENTHPPAGACADARIRADGRRRTSRVSAPECAALVG